MATTTYEHSTTTSSSGDIGLDRAYLTTIPSYLKIAECVVDVIAFICACIVYWSSLGGGWVQFVTMSAFVTTLILFIFHLFRIIYKLPGPWVLIELIYYCVFSLMMLIAAIVSAARAGYHSSIGATAELIYYVFYSLAMLIAGIVCAARGYIDGSIVAAAVFTFLATALYLVDTYFLYKKWREGGSGTGSRTTTTTTTTTETSYETRVQY